ncbi:uncharacterized protein DUF937 [Tahibacter aquaticus]|uniref:Uncharacterized protein DUF937 n=1 Tax=Tahibacter aquaticus TaxID=520092 RepID=A0A4V3DNL2_9GAMM|nr:DUF937 domain-containing protein [Tahibacter aquaticus]TDR48856.1 uncharacterized protein DUF937 [Tahibacter aquaticus]
MSGLVDAVMAQIGDNEIDAIAQQFGLSQGQAQSAIEQTLPLMVGAMAKNTATEDGANALHSALGAHEGVDLGGLLGGLFGGSGAGGSASGGGGLGGLGDLGALAGAVLGGMGGSSNAPGGQLDQGTGGGLAGGIGGAILGHIFGNRQGKAEQGLGQTTGLGSVNAGQLMAMLAPIVMAVLARMNKKQDLGPGGLSDMLGQETQRTRQSGGVGGGLLGAVLDRDGDGDVDLSDLLNVGSSVLAASRR